MMKNVYLLIVALIAIVAASGVFYFTHKPTENIACTQEAKSCPDGSVVGRVGPSCEFAPCPTDTVLMGTIKGKVAVGPICPVESPDAPCPVPPEAYTSREVILYSADGVTEIKRMYFASDGTYYFQVPAGTYVLNIPKQQSIGGSKELPETLILGSGKILEFDFSIDTGIR